jgi:hypothetical protein
MFIAFIENHLYAQNYLLVCIGPSLNLHNLNIFFKTPVTLMFVVLIWQSNSTYIWDIKHFWYRTLHFNSKNVTGLDVIFIIVYTCKQKFYVRIFNPYMYWKKESSRWIVVWYLEFECLNHLSSLKSSGKGAHVYIIKGKSRKNIWSRIYLLIIIVIEWWWSDMITRQNHMESHIF